MPTPTFQPPQGKQDAVQLQDYIVKLIRDLNFMLGNLDTLNVNRLDAKVIIAQTITALQIAANTITADKMSVTELSAITANLGTITAGIIYGAYIATANGTYPRIELSNTANLLTAFKTATDWLKIDADFTDPGIFFSNGSMTAALYLLTAFGSSLSINANGGNIALVTDADINLQSAAGTISDVVTVINGKQTAFTGLTGTVTVITGVDFVGSTTTSSTLHFTNGVLTSIS